MQCSSRVHESRRVCYLFMSQGIKSSFANPIDGRVEASLVRWSERETMSVKSTHSLLSLYLAESSVKSFLMLMSEILYLSKSPFVSEWRLTIDSSIWHPFSDSSCLNLMFDILGRTFSVRKIRGDDLSLFN